MRKLKTSDKEDHKPAPEHLAGARFRGGAEDMDETETVIMKFTDQRTMVHQDLEGCVL